MVDGYVDAWVGSVLVAVVDVVDVWGAGNEA